MSVRLNKVARDLNVGVQTIVEFLQKKGFEINVDPNTKISDEQHELLVKEFSTAKKLKKESENIGHDRQKRTSSTPKPVAHVDLHTRAYAKPRV